MHDPDAEQSHKTLAGIDKYHADLKKEQDKSDAIRLEYRAEFAREVIEKINRREVEVIVQGKHWPEGDRRQGNYELGYDDAKTDAVNLISSLANLTDGQ